MSEQTKGRDLWRSRHPKPEAALDAAPDAGTRSEDHPHATAGLAKGAALWHRRKAGGTFALGPEPLGSDITPSNDAA